jgi:hypothetical protein
MGSIADSRNTNRAIALLQRLGGSPEIAELKGETVQIIDVGIEGRLYSISAWIQVRLPDGEERTLDLGQVHEIVDEGVAGYALEALYPEDELKKAIEAELADPDSVLDEHEKQGLRRDLADLDGECRG